MVTEWRDRLGHSHPFLRLLVASEDLCACMARTWGMVITLEVGIRIAEKKVDRLWASWQEMQEMSPSEVGKVYGRYLNSRMRGLNVINLQEYRDR